MRVLIVLIVFAFIQVEGQDHHYKYGPVKMNEVIYVKPGEDFQIRCDSDVAVLARIYKPLDEVPAADVLNAISVSLSASRSERTTTIKDYENATKEQHEGFYTCVVHHEPDHEPHYSVAKCQVIVIDLCEDSGCEEDEICEPDYETGTVECTCNYQCPNNWDFICSSTCELFPHECAMEEKVCQDGIQRVVNNKGMCPNLVEPVIRSVDVDMEVALGEEIFMTSGLIEDGTPHSSVQWVFYPDKGGEPSFLSARDTHTFTADENSAGTYRITLMHCMNEAKAVNNEYRLSLITPPTTPAPTTPAPTTTPGPTTTEEGSFDLKTPGYTCSAFPGGAIDDFNGMGHFYDLSCTHILAADLMPGGSYLNPWFIYGTFDNHDGKTAMMSMTFYLGRDIFEVQRGWLVHTGGDKFVLEEGVPQEVGGSGCTVMFEDLHIQVDCQHFEGYYDGVMSGHIKLKGFGDQSLVSKTQGNIGLCFDNDSGWRANWQVGRTSGNCEVNKQEPACKSEAPESCQLSEPPVMGLEYTTCGTGAEKACGELHCDGNTPTEAQLCALEQANRVNCALKRGRSVAGEDEACTQDRCQYMKDIVSRGCPQENPPFDCP